jgi:glycine reductase complex component B subunit alpha and beta
MRLEMNYFDVKHVEFGPKTSFCEGLLTINREELVRLLSTDHRLKSVDIALAHPGERVRIANILEITEPRVKGDEDHYYPGMLGPIHRAGEGSTYVLRGAAVFEIGAIEGFYGGLVDMADAGSQLSPHSKTINICLLTEPATEIDPVEYGHALKHAGLEASVYLAKTAKGLTPDETEILDLNGPAGSLSGLPKVGYLFQLHSHGNSREPFVYGDNTRRYYPTILHPNEILDGAVVCGHYNIAISFKNTTYTILNHPVILGLYRRHGKEIDFRGVVVAPEPTSLSEITRTSMMSAGLLKHVLDVEGVIITKEGGGHTDVDLMENCTTCEEVGIKTVLVDNEWLGPDGSGEFPLLASSPNANAMVSVGNMDAVVHLPAMQRVIGGPKLTEFNMDLEGAFAIPLRFIPNGISQAGFGYLTTEAR